VRPARPFRKIQINQSEGTSAVYVHVPRQPQIRIPDGPVARRRLEGDWLATDADGRIALFAGGDSGPVPEGADPEATAEALAAMDAAADARAAVAQGEAYRGAGGHRPDPIFDVPVDAGAAPHHDRAYAGYPHLVFVQDLDALRREVEDVPFREAAVRAAFAVIFPELGPLLHEALHARGICVGCRPLDPPEDPRPRAPEVVAAGGIYAYVHSGNPHDGWYHRFASPPLPADPGRLEPLVERVARLVVFPFRFETETRVSANG
jgi:hypothetical protein